MGFACIGLHQRLNDFSAFSVRPASVGFPGFLNQDKRKTISAVPFQSIIPEVNVYSFVVQALAFPSIFKYLCSFLFFLNNAIFPSKLLYIYI